MRKEEIEKILFLIGYSKDGVKSLLLGRMRPPLLKAIFLEENYNIPAIAWKDIKSYIKNDTEKQSTRTTTKKRREVA